MQIFENEDSKSFYEACSHFEAVNPNLSKQNIKCLLSIENDKFRLDVGIRGLKNSILLGY